MKTRNWNALWIWENSGETEENAYYYFRKTFNLEKNSGDYNLYITAEAAYKLYINGTYAGTGPVLSQPYFKYYDAYKINQYLKEGINCIAIIGFYSGHIEGDRGGLLAEITDENGSTVLNSDKSWKVRTASAWDKGSYKATSNRVTPFQETYNAKKEPKDWETADFNDSDWDNAVELMNNWKFPLKFSGAPTTYPSNVTPWTYLLERDIPFMAEKRVFPKGIEYVEECIHLDNRVQGNNLSMILSTVGKQLKFTKITDVNNLIKEDGVTVVQNGIDDSEGYIDGIYDPCIVLDFGKVVTARIELDIEAGADGGSIDIGYAERLVDGHFVNSIECPFADRYIMRSGKQTFRPFTWEAFRYVKLRFYDCFPSVVLNSVSAIQTSYPFEEKGEFESSDDKLNKVFDISRYTIKLCCQDSIMDTPWREKGQWLGDVSAVSLGGIYSCFGDTLLPSKFLRQSAENQLCIGIFPNVTNRAYGDKAMFSNISDYSLWWIEALWKHYMYTGDEQWIHNYYPHVIKIIQAFLRNADQDGILVNMPYWTFIDWVKLDKKEQSSTLNAIYYGVLEYVEKMAAFKSDKYFEDMVHKARVSIRNSFVDRFYNKELGCFADARHDGKLSTGTSEHANSAAILFGLCDEKMANEIVDRLYRDKTLRYIEAQPFFTTFVLQALDKLGRFDLALEIIRERWGKRMVDKGASSTYEQWSINGDPRYGGFTGFIRSQSHAWSAHPAEFLIRNIIGLKVIEPGCRKITLNPKITDFDYKIAYPTPKGEIIVENKAGKVTYKLPEGMSTEK